MMTKPGSRLRPILAIVLLSMMSPLLAQAPVPAGPRGPAPAARANAPTGGAAREEPVSLTVDATTPRQCMNNWRILQGAIDHAPAEGCRIVLPAGRVAIARTLNVWRDNVQIQGRGLLATTLEVSGTQAPTIVHGVVPRFQGRGLERGDFVDVAPLLDGSARGLGPRLRGGKSPLHLTLPMTSWSHPALAGKHGAGIDTWDAMPAICLESAIDTGPAGFRPGDFGILCGVGSASRPRPLYVRYELEQLVLHVETTDGKIHRSTCSIKGARGVLRWAVQIHPESGRVDWITNRKWRADAIQFDEWAPGSKLSGNDDFPFKFAGIAATDSVQTDSVQIDPTFGFTLLGARLSDAIRYAPNRLPGDDASCYRRADDHTVALLPMDDDLNYVLSSRIFGTFHGPASGANSPGAGWLFCSDGGALPFVKNFALRDLTVRGGGHYGMAVALGLSLNSRLTDVRLEAAATGLGCLKLGSNYTTYLDGVNYVGGGMFAIHQYYQILKATGVLNVGTCGLASVWSDLGNFEFDQMFLAYGPSPAARCMVYSRGVLAGRSLVIDNEESTDRATRLSAMIRCDLAPHTGTNELRMGRLEVARVPRNSAMISLGRQAGTLDAGLPHGRVAIDVLVCDTPDPFRAVYDVGDSRWLGDMECSWLPRATPHLIVSSPDGRCRVRHTYAFLDDIPTDGSWVEGCHILIFPQPKKGGWRSAICVGSGVGREAKWEKR